MGEIQRLGTASSAATYHLFNKCKAINAHRLMQLREFSKASQNDIVHRSIIDFYHIRNVFFVLERIIKLQESKFSIVMPFRRWVVRLAEWKQTGKKTRKWRIQNSFMGFSTHTGMKNAPPPEGYSSRTVPSLVALWKFTWFSTRQLHWQRRWYWLLHFFHHFGKTLPRSCAPKTLVSVFGGSAKLYRSAAKFFFS